MDKLRLIVGMGILGLSASALAAEEKSAGNRAMADLDTDGDGSVNFAEFQARGSDALTNMDSDANGVLTIDEFLNSRPGQGFGNTRGRGGDARPEGEPSEEQLARMQERMAERGEPSEEQIARREEMRELQTQHATEQFQEMDTNGDEIVSLDEFQEANFLRLDRDNNGALTARELRPQRGGRPGAGRRGPGGPRGGRTPQV